MNDITLYDRIANPLDAVMQFGNFLTRSGMFGCEKPEQGQLLALTMLCERKSPVQLLKEYHLINGRLVDRVDALASKFIAMGGQYVVNERTSDRASVTLTTRTQTMKFTLNWDDIKDETWVKTRTGDLKDIYKTPRGRMKMLFWRVLADAIAVMSPNVVTGLPDGEDETPSHEIGASKDLLRLAESPPVETSPVSAEPVTPPIAAQNSDEPPPEVQEGGERERPARPAAVLPKAAAIDPKTGSLTDATVAALQLLTKGRDADARAFAIAKGWIGKDLVAGDEWWRFVALNKINYIFKHPSDFLAAIQPGEALLV